MDEAKLYGTGNFIGVRRRRIRPELAEFIAEMEDVLRENDHKSGWDTLSYNALFCRIRDEFEEMGREYKDAIDPEMASYEAESIQNMRREAIDIANFCMFLCHNYPKDEDE